MDTTETHHQADAAREPGADPAPPDTAGSPIYDALVLSWRARSRAVPATPRRAYEVRAHGLPLARPAGDRAAR
ncbi:hypothetical protein [Streptomyces sp. NPDC005805]|uniref:hypothetical protein n=1 Tax=Streptomyces sp. NPDC005805 TaxID=3157068 RepID=UPI0033C75DA5